MTCLQLIEDFYGTKKAKRSGVLYINHIYEGLQILEKIKASQATKDAYCIHPMLQVPTYLKETIEKQLYINIDKYVLLLAMEYRNKANAYVCRERTDYFKLTDLPHMVLPEVRDMLIADKVQNYGDFIKYHKYIHPRKKQLDKYFNLWFEHLKVDYEKLKIK